MQNWILNIDWNLWEVVKKGNQPRRIVSGSDGVISFAPPKTNEEALTIQREEKVRTILLQAIPIDYLSDFHYYIDARDLWLRDPSQRVQPVV